MKKSIFAILAVLVLSAGMVAVNPTSVSAFKTSNAKEAIEAANLVRERSNIKKVVADLVDTTEIDAEIKAIIDDNTITIAQVRDAEASYRKVVYDALKDQLKDAATHAGNLDQNIYTAESMDVVLAVLRKIEVILNGDEKVANLENITEAVNLINEYAKATEQLVEKPVVEDPIPTPTPDPAPVPNPEPTPVPTPEVPETQPEKPIVDGEGKPEAKPEIKAEEVPTVEKKEEVRKEVPVALAKIQAPNTGFAKNNNEVIAIVSSFVALAVSTIVAKRKFF